MSISRALPVLPSFLAEFSTGFVDKRWIPLYTLAQACCGRGPLATACRLGQPYLSPIPCLTTGPRQACARLSTKFFNLLPLYIYRGKQLTALHAGLSTNVASTSLLLMSLIHYQDRDGGARWA